MGKARSLTSCLSLLPLLALAFCENAYAQGIQQGVEDLTAKLAKNAKPGHTLTVVVSNFTDLQGSTCDLGRYVAERVTTRLTQTPGFRVIERRRLNQVLQELAFGMDGLVDPSKAKQVGKMLGADSLVVGTISDLGPTVELDARVIEIETGNILPGAFSALSKDPVISELSQRGCSGPSANVNTTVSSSGRPATSVAQSVRQRKLPRPIESWSIAFEISRCITSGNEVRCDIMATNKGEDDQVRFWTGSIHGSRLFDSVGNEHLAKTVEIGNKASRGDNNPAEVTLISNVKTMGALRFEGVKEESTSASLLDVVMYKYERGNWRQVRAKFRDVPIEK